MIEIVCGENRLISCSQSGSESRLTPVGISLCVQPVVLRDLFDSGLCFSRVATCQATRGPHCNTHLVV